MGYIFMAVFMILGIATHTENMFMIAGLFGIAGSIEFLAHKIPKFEVVEHDIKDLDEEQKNKLRRDAMIALIEELRNKGKKDES